MTSNKWLLTVIPIEEGVCRSPEKTLLVQMVCRAVWDLSNESKRVRKSAKDWFTFGCIGQVTFDDCCEHLKVDGKRIIKRLVELEQLPQDDDERPRKIFREVKIRRLARVNRK